MAYPWGITTAGWAFVAVGWLLSPIFSLFWNKFFAYLASDTARKLRELKINIIPTLKQMVRDMEEQRMGGPAKGTGSESDLATLEEKEKVLKSALYDAEDILDLVNYYRIEKKVMGDGESHLRISWVHTAASTCITRCKGSWLVTHIAKCLRWLCATVCRSSELPIFQRQSNLVVQRFRAWSRSFDSKAVCGSMKSWFAKAYTSVCYYRDWSYEVVGIKITQKDDSAVDYFLLTIDGKSLMVQIEKIENSVNDLKKSHKDSSSSEILKDTNKESTSTQEVDTNKENSSKEEIDNLHRNIKREVFGRDQEREDICSMFPKGPDADAQKPCTVSQKKKKPYTVIGIYGITGSGKSTLAQFVCDHEKKDEDKHFHFIMFSHVSTTFRVDKIFRDMLEQMKEQRPSSTEGQEILQKKLKDQPSNTQSLEALQEELKEKLQGGPFLLVLDDLWVNNENQKGRDILLDVLDSGQSGSVILVTAQTEKAAAALGAQKQFLIRDLEDKHYLSLFMHHARPGAIDFDGEYGRIGRKIANKLHSSPIAAVTVGTQLLRKSISFWEATANNDVLNETMGALWWSYRQLGPDIRRCFAYCSTFPRGYKLKRVELIRIWIAQGFVNIRSDATEELEDVGRLYFDELLTFSFLMQVQNMFLNSELFTIHDLLHELAERVAVGDFHRIDVNGSATDIPRGVRHVFIEANNGAEIAEKDLVGGNLRTLIIKDTNRKQPKEVAERNHELEKVFERLFMRLRKLRVLIVEQNFGIEVLSVPASIDQMKHLRYLGFHYANRRLILPSTFSKLYLLQTIDVPMFCKVSCCENMANLIHLRHTSFSLSFPNIGRLTSLQRLECFIVREEQGYELKQLKHLNKLRGDLEIHCLGIVGGKDEALEAHLASKKRITGLHLFFEWESRSPDVQAQVLEGLYPPKDLVELRIVFYKGSRYPSWMLSGQNLQELVLRKCSRLESIPKDSELFIHLLKLRIEFCDWVSLPENMENLKSLQYLEIEGCNEMELLTSQKKEKEKEMELLPALPPSLRHIAIIDCHVLYRTCREEGHQNWHTILQCLLVGLTVCLVPHSCRSKYLRFHMTTSALNGPECV